MNNYHDFLISKFTIGPRRELVLKLNDVKNMPYGSLRFSAIENYSLVQDWHQGNEENIDEVNEENKLALIESVEHKKKEKGLHEYIIRIEHFDLLEIVGREIQEMKT